MAKPLIIIQVISVALLLLCVRCAPSYQPPIPGIQILSVTDQGVLEADVQPGDLWHSYLVNSRSYPLNNTFDFLTLTQSHAPSGKVTVIGLRNGLPLETRLPSALRGVKIQALFPSHINSATQDANWIQAAIKAKDTIGAAQLSMAHTLALIENNQIKAAHTELNRTLSLAPQYSHHILFKTGIALSRQGAHTQAVDSLTNAYQSYTAANLEAAAAGAESELGKAYWRAGDRIQAQHQLQRSLAVYQRLFEDNLQSAANLTNLGLLAWQLGDQDKALAFGRRALTIKRRLNPRGLTTVRSCLNLAHVETARGNLRTAESLLSEGLANYENHFKNQPGGDDRLYGRLLVARGNVANHRWDLIAAERDYVTALATAKRVGDSRSIASTLNNLGTLAEQRSDWQAARSWYEQGLTLAQGINDNAETRAILWNNLGYLEYRLGDFEQALTYLNQTADYLGAGSDRVPMRMFLLQNYARVHTARGDLRAARSCLEEALCIALETNATGYDQAHSHHLMGLTALAERHPEAAETSFYRALDALDRQLTVLGGKPMTRTEFTANYLVFYEDLIDLLMTNGKTAQAFRVQERARSPLLRGMLDRTLTLGSEPGVLADLLPTQAAAFPALGPNQFQAELEPGTLFLTYSVLRDKTYLFALQSGANPQAFTTHTIDIGERGLALNVAGFRQELEKTRRLEVEAALQQRGEGLFNLLLAPVLPMIQTADRILIAPDGPLHQLPFAALSPGGGVHNYLVQWKPLGISASATVYAALKQRPPVSRQRAAVFGDPHYAAQLAALPATRREAAAVAETMGEGVAIFLGDRATRKNALELDQSWSHIHFALHAVLNEAMPTHSALAFSIETEDGSESFLEVGRILDDLRLNADLVVLSACETARGRDLGGEGPGSLSFAFQCIGARSVAATLWRVDDQAGADLMSHFYASLWSGQTKLDALRSAQLAMINREDHQRRPFYWAAYQLSGLWR